jgi:hypothetical protein
LTARIQRSFPAFASSCGPLRLWYPRPR